MATNLLRCGMWYKTTKSQMAAIDSGAGETPKAKHASDQASDQAKPKSMNKTKRSRRNYQLHNLCT
jgi:hypothetical protein